MALYLDEAAESGGLLGNAAEGTLLNAARLGLVFTGDTEQKVILKFPENQKNDNEKIYNTVLNGTVLGDDEVLQPEDGEVRAVKDPSEFVSAYTIQMSDTSVRLPAQPLVEMKLNQIYAVDVYFYIEGCDPDCSGSIHFDASDLHLAFYGILTE